MLDPYSSLKQYRQFIIWKAVWNAQKAKWIKFPCNPNGAVADAHQPQNHMSHSDATLLAEVFGEGYGVGFVFTALDPFWVVDIDGAYTEAGWSALALELINSLPHALVEVSQSGQGIHIIGSGVIPPHAKKNQSLHIECYNELRFIALGRQETAYGDAGLDLSPYIAQVVEKYFPLAIGGSEIAEWTTEAVPEWNGYATDEELLKKMLSARNVGATFGDSLSVAQLWAGDEAALAKAFPDSGDRSYDASSADASLAQRLAFYTGKNCERIERIMRMSGLVRDKWDSRADYLERTILRACNLQIEVFAFPIIDTTAIAQYEPTALIGKSEAQVAFAETLRAEMLMGCTDLELGKRLATVTDPSFWLDNKGQDLVAMGKQLLPATILLAADVVQEVDGLRFVDRDGQKKLFEGCVYLSDRHAVFCPTKTPNILTPETFNVEFGGWEFQMAWTKEEMKDSKKAFDAFTQTRLLVWPKASGTCFRPELAYGALVPYGQGKRVNLYNPASIRRVKGDITLFLSHMAKLLPIQRDRDILLAYMAACVQHKGYKFQWAPLVQGCEGNGKTLLSMCVQEAVGAEYCHSPKAAQLGGQFNSWQENKVFIFVEDIFVAEHKMEVMEALKPMITGSRGVEIEGKGKNQHSADLCCNFMFNSNHKNALRKTENDRRFCVFYTAQQEASDLKRDGMSPDRYFPRLYNWLFGRGEWEKEGAMYGFAVVSEFLHTYVIPDEFNPATLCQRAPITSSTAEAITSSLGGIEQEVVEAISEGRVGFAGGWVSSFALEQLLTQFRSEKAIPQNKRRDLLRGLGYDYHPTLKDGRVNNPMASEGGKKPRLFIRDGHPAIMLTNGAEVARVYQDAQNWAKADAAFGSGK